MRIFRNFFTAALVLASAPAFADPLAAFVGCAAETDKEKRLACFDRAMLRAGGEEPTEPKPFWATQEKRVGNWRVFIGADEFDDSPMASMTARDLGPASCESSADPRRRALTLSCVKGEIVGRVDLQCVGDEKRQWGIADFEATAPDGARLQDYFHLRLKLEARIDQGEIFDIRPDPWDILTELPMNIFGLEGSDAQSLGEAAEGGSRLVMRTNLVKGSNEPIRIDLDGFDEAYAHVRTACAAPEPQSAPADAED